MQFTRPGVHHLSRSHRLPLSIDGRGQVFDNTFIERLWRSVKYEDIYLKDYETIPALVDGLGAYFDKYNHWRPHQSFDYETPAQVYFQAA